MPNVLTITQPRAVVALEKEHELGWVYKLLLFSDNINEHNLLYLMWADLNNKYVI